ncbi:hypothetical protein BJX68DRAFT_163221 [Aspergillus pseudodeflectus]|uniref:Uncharacterized protein n=1 Tax=Aspergillus pseudodeflectus TaxID=176178 RepID=A0ABR4L136_9EURO
MATLMGCGMASSTGYLIVEGYATTPQDQHPGAGGKKGVLDLHAKQRFLNGRRRYFLIAQCKRIGKQHDKNIWKEGVNLLHQDQPSNCKYPTNKGRNYNAHMKIARHADRAERKARRSVIEQEEKN